METCLVSTMAHELALAAFIESVLPHVVLLTLPVSLCLLEIVWIKLYKEGPIERRGAIGLSIGGNITMVNTNVGFVWTHGAPRGADLLC